MSISAITGKFSGNWSNHLWNMPILLFHFQEENHPDTFAENIVEQ
jgi:hypothetical protein